MRRLARLAAMALLIVLVAPSQWLLRATGRGPASRVLPRIFHRLTCAVLGLRVEVVGAPVRGRQVVYISNHLSYLDIPVIGSVLTASFVAKDDIRHWPLLGWLAGLQRTLFISRHGRRADSAEAALRQALQAGDSLVLFPEGTTSDGSTVLPFKSSLFQALTGAGAGNIVLQPVSLQLLSVDDRPVAEPGIRDRYAYYAEMRLGRHFLNFVRQSGAGLRLVFHAPVSDAARASRKLLAATAWTQAAGQARDFAALDTDDRAGAGAETP